MTYYNTCCSCGDVFLGAKHSFVCKPCRDRSDKAKVRLHSTTSATLLAPPPWRMPSTKKTRGRREGGAQP